MPFVKNTAYTPLNTDHASYDKVTVEALVEQYRSLNANLAMYLNSLHKVTPKGHFCQHNTFLMNKQYESCVHHCKLIHYGEHQIRVHDVNFSRELLWMRFIALLKEYDEILDEYDTFIKSENEATEICPLDKKCFTSKCPLRHPKFSSQKTLQVKSQTKLLEKRYRQLLIHLSPSAMKSPIISNRLPILQHGQTYGCLSHALDVWVQEIEENTERNIICSYDSKCVNPNCNYQHPVLIQSINDRKEIFKPFSDVTLAVIELKKDIKKIVGPLKCQVWPSSYQLEAMDGTMLRSLRDESKKVVDYIGRTLNPCISYTKTGKCLNATCAYPHSPILNQVTRFHRWCCEAYEAPFADQDEYYEEGLGDDDEYYDEGDIDDDLSEDYDDSLDEHDIKPAYCDEEEDHEGEESHQPVVMRGYTDRNPYLHADDQSEYQRDPNPYVKSFNIESKSEPKVQKPTLRPESKPFVPFQLNDKAPPVKANGTSIDTPEVVNKDTDVASTITGANTTATSTTSATTATTPPNTTIATSQTPSHLPVSPIQSPQSHLPTPAPSQSQLPTPTPLPAAFPLTTSLTYNTNTDIFGNVIGFGQKYPSLTPSLLPNPSINGTSALSGGFQSSLLSAPPPGLGIGSTVSNNAFASNSSLTPNNAFPSTSTLPASNSFPSTSSLPQTSSNGYPASPPGLGTATPFPGYQTTPSSLSNGSNYQTTSLSMASPANQLLLSQSPSAATSGLYQNGVYNPATGAINGTGGDLYKSSSNTGLLSNNNSLLNNNDSLLNNNNTNANTNMTSLGSNTGLSEVQSLYSPTQLPLHSPSTHLQQQDSTSCYPGQELHQLQQNQFQQQHLQQPQQSRQLASIPRSFQQWYTELCFLEFTHNQANQGDSAASASGLDSNGCLDSVGRNDSDNNNQNDYFKSQSRFTLAKTIVIGLSSSLKDSSSERHMMGLTQVSDDDVNTIIAAVYLMDMGEVEKLQKCDNAFWIKFFKKHSFPMGNTMLFIHHVNELAGN